jgi:hypothetical protein
LNERVQKKGARKLRRQVANFTQIIRQHELGPIEPSPSPDGAPVVDPPYLGGPPLAGSGSVGNRLEAPLGKLVWLLLSA